MCGRCAVITEKACLHKIAGTSKWRRQEEKVTKKYNLCPYDKSVCVPVIHTITVSAEEAGAGSTSTSKEQGTPGAGAPAFVDHKSVVLSGMRWGLVPAFAREEPQKFTFNSRSDKLLASGMWNRLLKSKSRCIVVLQGFFEWGKEKRPRYVQMAKNYPGFSVQDDHGDHETAGEITQSTGTSSSTHVNQPQKISNSSSSKQFKELNNGKNFPLLVCGIHDRWSGPGYSVQQPLESVSIVTTATPQNSGLFPIHDRIPLMITSKELAAKWLHDDKTPFAALLQEIEQANRSGPLKLEIFEVNKLVGNSKNETPDCILPSGDYDKKQFEKNFGRFLKPKQPVKQEPPVQESGEKQKEVSGPTGGATTSSEAGAASNKREAAKAEVKMEEGVALPSDEKKQKTE
ncbi:unnamed protein product [Amoebophrya sp. A120]|nr:unnamed protein product [Amoebophrya sp. A120]|eukprot:GSA120T00021504001.1